MKKIKIEIVFVYLQILLLVKTKKKIKEYLLIQGKPLMSLDVN